MKKRLLAAVLCIAMLLSCVPSFAFKAQASDIPVIRYNGTAQSSVSFPRNERLTLTAVNGSQFQWQIWVSGDLWVNISGATGDTLDVSYAMIANLCEGDTAYIRVRATVDGQQVCSDYVAVTAAEAKIEAAEEPATYVVQAAPEAIVYESSAPTQATQAPQADNSVAEAQAAVQAAQTAVNAAYATWQEKEAAYYAQEAVYTPLAEDAAAKLAAYEAAQAKADAAKQAWLNSGVEVEVTPAETSAEEFDEAGNPVVLVPAQTAVTYNAELEAAYNAAQAEADSALQSYQAAEAARAEAEATLNAIDAEWIAADNALAAAQDALEEACLALDALQGSTGSSNYGLRANSGISTYDLEPTPDSYSVVINYVFSDGKTAAQSYSAKLAAGSSYVAAVKHPTVQGYLPYVDGARSDQIDLNISNIQADVTYTVTYQPDNVGFKVEHYLQNAENDQYTLHETVTKDGYTDDYVGAGLEKKYDGFYSLLYNTEEKIAADGSTLIKIYYDRYYYLMNFDLDGGYGVEPIYARYGAPVSGVGTPKKAGYSFVGWNPSVPSTVPAENKTFTAQWKADDSAKVTVVFWGENADDEEYSYIKSAEVYVKPGTEFTYSESGTLICVIEEHTHNLNDCYQLTCAQEEHTHSASCYTCGQGSHTHSTACYTGVGSRSAAGWDAPDNPSNGYVAREAWTQNAKVIYINGTWYKYTGTTGTGSIATPTCGQTEGTHTHTDACLGCNKTAHDHSVENGCYELTCPKTEHSHTSDCYLNGAGLDSDKWKFDHSDTVTVAADGSTVVNVYYNRCKYDVQFFSRKSPYPEYTDLKITAKWGENILEKWPTYDGSSSWYVSTSGNVWQNSIQVMPVGGAKFYGPKTGESSITAYYYVEVLPGETGEPHNGVTYKLHHSDTSSSTGTVTSDDKYAIQGFTYKEGTANGQSYSGAKFYYTRNAYDIKFFNPTDLIKTVEEVPYEMPLGDYDFIPGDEWIPEQYEPGSMVFAGWYLNPECTGEQYVLSEHTMPLGAENHEAALSLYAKWVPVTHTVEYYLDADALAAGTKLMDDAVVPHGSKVDPTPADPTNGSYTFVGWFYMENGVEKAFDFANMPVTKDLQVYGKWSSNVMVDYTIYYQLADGTTIADPTTGKNLAGITKTFEAKYGDELYADYRSGYFPETSSHNLEMNIEGSNEYIFVYVAKEEVAYTVKYLEKDTNVVLKEEKNDVTRDAVITEKFEYIPGYAPDAYQKRLILSANEAENVIIFWYVKDELHAPVQKIHWIQNITGDGYTEYQSSTDLNGVIGQDYTETQLTISGFKYNSEKSNPSGTLTGAGLVLNLYYDRIEYPYEFKFLAQGTEETLADSVTGKARFQAQVNCVAPTIPGYKLVSAGSQAINIQIEDPADVANKNVKIFYYQEETVTINYQVVGPAGCNPADCGSVSRASETLNVITGTAQGSTATAADNFRFVGWYSDESCTTPVDSSWVSGSTNVPAKTETLGEKLGYKAATYYAKFEYDLTTLTITKSGNVGAKDGFIFDVKVKGEDTILFTVSVQGNGSVTIAGLKVGTTYTVTERSDWAWRYSVPSAQEVTLVANGNTVTFENGEGKPYLLDGSDYARNNSVLYSPSGEN